MSVTIADTATVSSTEYIREFPGFGLVKITAGQIRELDLGVTAEPTDSDPAHAYVHGKKTPAKKKKLALACEWVIKP